MENLKKNQVLQAIAESYSKNIPWLPTFDFVCENKSTNTA